MEKIVGILHLLLFLFSTVYAYFFKKNWFDLYYLLYIFGCGLSWSIFNGECIISLFLKKRINPHYKMGEDISAEDLYAVLGKKYKTQMYYFLIFSSLIQAYSIYLVLNRNNINGFYLGAIFLYLIGIKITNSILFQWAFLFIFLYILFNIIHKLW